MAKSCPSVAVSNVQIVYAVLEDVSGELQPPVADGYILPAGRATMTQTVSYSDSEELSASLNTLEQFQNAVEAGTGSIQLYGRLDRNYGKPEGDALFVALMGDYNDPARITAKIGSDATAEATSISISNINNANQIDGNILEGKFPPRGVIHVGEEKILYRGIMSSSSGATLLNCRRGYANTKAAALSTGAGVQLLSRVYSQAVCRPTCSIYILNDDKLLLFMSGCSVTSDTVRLQREQGQMFTFEFQGRRMGWCGVSEVDEILGATIKLAQGGADAYCVGGYIRNRTRNDTHDGQGYRVVGVDDTNDTITLNYTPTDWQAGDVLAPWLPQGKPIGTAIASRDANVEIDGIAGKMQDGGLTISCPVTHLLEIGDEFVGEGISGRRSITLERSVNFRARDGREFGRGYRGYELPVCVLAGKEAGLTLAHYMGRVKFGTPEIGEADDVVTMTQNGTALGIEGEDALYIIQE